MASSYHSIFGRTTCAVCIHSAGTCDEHASAHLKFYKDTLNLSSEPIILKALMPSADMNDRLCAQ